MRNGEITEITKRKQSKGRAELRLIVGRSAQETTEYLFVIHFSHTNPADNVYQTFLHYISLEDDEKPSPQSWIELRREGAQVEWLEYPNEGHVKRSPANVWWVHRRNLDWFRFWLRDEEDPDPTKSEQYARWRGMRKNWEAAKAAAKTMKN